MARRKRKTKLTVSLFPFLSILACVIGTLTLMITALALGQMDTDTVARAEKYEKASRQLETDRDVIRRMKIKISQVEAYAGGKLKELADARRRLDRLQREKLSILRAKDGEKPPVVLIPTVDPEKQKRELSQLEDELHKQKEAMDRLLAELKERKKPPEEAEVLIQPGGSGVDLDPTFVECAASGIVIYEGAQPHRVHRKDLATDKTFTELLDRVAKQPKATVIFLVRDDGLGTYHAAGAIARSHYARNGKLPVVGHGKIDLSFFKGKR